MPRKNETEEQRARAQQVRRELHHDRIDIIKKLGGLLLDGREKNMEINDILAAVNHQVTIRRPGLEERDNGYLFRRTVEFDGVRESICVTSDMRQNRAKWQAERLRKDKAEKKFEEKKPKRSNGSPIMKTTKPRIKPSPLARPVCMKPIVMKSSPRYETFDMVEEMATIAKQGFVNLTPRQTYTCLIAKKPKQQLQLQPQPKPELKGVNLAPRQESVTTTLAHELEQLEPESEAEGIREFVSEWDGPDKFEEFLYGQPDFETLATNVNDTWEIIGGPDELAFWHEQTRDIDEFKQEYDYRYNRMPEFNTNTFNAFFD